MEELRKLEQVQRTLKFMESRAISTSSDPDSNRFLANLILLLVISHSTCLFRFLKSQSFSFPEPNTTHCIIFPTIQGTTVWRTWHGQQVHFGLHTYAKGESLFCSFEFRLPKLLLYLFMHKLLFLVTILLLLTFPQSFVFVYQENANPNAHCQISVAFLEEASLLITQESITEAEDERKGLFMLWIYFIWMLNCFPCRYPTLYLTIFEYCNLYLVDLLLYTERVFENLQWVKKNILHYPCFWFLGIWKIDAIFIFIFEHVISLTQPNGDHKLVTPYPRPCRLYMIFWPWNISWDV